MAIVDFLYYGEANVYQENIDAFLAIAEELQLKGLTGNGTNEKVEEEGNTYKETIKPTIKKDPNSFSTENIFQSSSNENDLSEGTVAVTHFTLSEDLKNLDDKINSLISKSENKVPQGKTMVKATVCAVCGKEGTLTHIKDHIEAHHLEGVSIPCNFCEKTFRSRNAFKKHSSLYHK